MPQAFLTPDFPPDHKFYTRRLQIPANAAFLGLVNGALYELCKPHNFEADGEMTPQETADYFLAMWTAYLHNENEPPEWETPDEADGQPEQPWYESLSDWIIQGFLAITFTPLAALTYQATVPKLRIAIRTGNLGALFRVLINGIEVWTGDSYGPITDLLEQTFDMSAETEPYTVRIEHNGIGEGHGLSEAKLEVIRGEAVAQMVATILRADPFGCGVQWSTDNGDTWETVSLSDCISVLAYDAAQNAIADAIATGQIQKPGGQPAPANAPAEGTCKTYHIALSGNEQWRLPSGLGFGDTLQVSNATGGWSDGSLSWYCPEGSRYLVGQCSEELRTHQEGDVLNPGAYHMALVMLVDETWYEAPTTVFEQQSGTEPLVVVFQANDGSLSDNTGQIEFDLEVCRGVQPDTWEHTVNFGTDGYTGFAGLAGYNYVETTFLGVVAIGAAVNFGFRWTFNPWPADTQLTEIEMTGPYWPRDTTYSFDDGVNQLIAGSLNFTTANPQVFGTPLDLDGAIHFSLVSPSDAGTAIGEIIFRGTGTNPFTQ